MASPVFFSIHSPYPGRRVMAATACVLFVFLLLPAASSAQFFSFGRNKVQYTDFDWHVLKTQHFDIYYYPEMQELAGQGAALAEESYRVLEQRFNHTVLNRIPLILYSSHLHFQQTNTTPGFVPEGVGGFFEFVKGRVVIPFDGSMWDFRHVIRHELVHVFMHSKIRSSFYDHRMLMDRLPPLWFTEGLAEYWSAGWDGQAEMVMRDAVISGYLTPLSDMDDIYGTFLMYKEGQNLLRFMSARYGEYKILQLMDNFWRSSSFEDDFRATLGIGYREFDREWTYALKKECYPLLSAADEPSHVSDPIVTGGFNSKPVVIGTGDHRTIYFIGNRDGYTSVYSIPWGIPGAKPSIVVRGEQSNQFEAFHLFQSKLAISKDSILAFVTKSGETDALHLYSIPRKSVIGLLRFRDLVVIGSPSWSPDGSRLVFPAAGMSGNYDLYLYTVKSGDLQRLTNDSYDDRDPDWSPDGTGIVFSSDRGANGDSGCYNLFMLDPDTHGIRYLTSGRAVRSSPAFSPDGRAIAFTSDEGGARNIWMMTLDSLRRPAVMKRITGLTTAAFDPAWADSGLVMATFENFGFQIRSLQNVYAVYDTTSVVRPVIPQPPGPHWTAASVSGTSESQPLRYSGEYSLDIAQSQISTDPVFGTAGGAYLSLSDLLGNEQYEFLLYNTAQSSDEFLSSFNIAISRLSLSQRANYAYGIYRFSGRRYDLTDPAEYFYERVFGGYFTLSYPLSKFRRISVSTSVSNSEKDVTQSVFYNGPDENVDRSRRALFLSNAISFTHDNSLWSPCGPIDGQRFSLTLAYTTDVQFSNANYYSIIADYRQYFRLADRSAYAVRAWLLYNNGNEARRFFMGGSWDLRGYDRWSIRGTKMWLLSQELRFPLIDVLDFRLPFVGISFSGFRGALFADAGNAWDDVYPGTLGSVGGGVRLNLGGFIVLRYDTGKQILQNFTKLQDGWFGQFFFGWDF